MTFRWNPGPDEPRYGDAAPADQTDDPASPYKRHENGQASPSPQAHSPVDPGSSASGHQAGSDVASRNGRPAGDQPLGAADLVSYGYDADELGAGHQQPGGAAAAEGAWAFPSRVSQPGPDQPESGPYGPPETEASGVPAAMGDRPHRDWPHRDWPHRDWPHRATRGRRGRRVWLVVGAVLVLMVAAAALLVGRLGHSGQAAQPAAAPSHMLATPQKIGTYTRDQQAEQQLGLSHGEQYLTQIDPGHVAGIVAAIYDTGGPASSPDRVAIMAGRLVKSPLNDVIKGFTQQETAEGNAPMKASAGPLGGQAACAGKGGSGICVWADSDTVGVLVSATINASALARTMLSMRSGIEFLAG
jgi:hypothetical protein